MDSLYLSWRYICHNKARTATLVACITLIAFLPLALDLLLDRSEEQLMSRAESTPLLVGAKGSALDLSMNTLYFGDQVPELIPMKASDKIMDSDLAISVPMYVRYKARGFPIVGTTFDYFEFRKLVVEKGEMLTLLGDCIVGATVANALGLSPGSSLVSSPESLFDLTGVYPLKMKVKGILKRTYTPDDIAVFVDLKTAWIIQGLMHGHKDVKKDGDKSVILKKTDQNITANAKLFQYTEITEKNMDSFHFHGDTSSYPLTAVMVFPNDKKSGTILMGRYLSKEESLQIIKPRDVIAGLMETIFRFKNILDAVIMMVGLATLLAIILVFALSLRLRQAEIQTIFRLGCQKMTMGFIFGAEIVIITILSGLFCAGLLFLVNFYADDLVRMVFIR
jgi:putative ABC transport system permease protein